MLRTVMRVVPGLPLLLSMFACGGGEAPADRQQRTQAARADSMAMAEAAYDASVFDTLSWADTDERLKRGRVVWRYSCLKCHGQTGRGGGEMAQQAGFEVPSLVNEDWEYGGDIPAIRHRIFVGHEGEMPNWGLHGLKYRDIDAVADYIQRVLRAEM